MTISYTLRYITPEQTKALYVFALERSSGKDFFDVANIVAGIIDIFAQKPYLSFALLLYDTADLMADLMYKSSHMNALKEAYDNGKGIVIVDITYAAPKCGGSVQYLKVWDGKMGQYPYANADVFDYPPGTW